MKNIISAEEIKKMKGLKKSHFLNPDAKRINKSLGDLTGLTGLGFHIIEVPTGCESTEYHVHYFEDECAYVLEGEGVVTIGAETTSIGPGDFIGYPAGGEAHTMRNMGEVPLRCIIVGQRLSHDVGDYPNLKKRIYRNKGQTWNLVSHNDIEYPNAGKK